MSVKLDIYNAIETSIRSLVTNIETVELWNSQIENEETELPHVYPAVFVEFQEMKWDITKQTPIRSTNVEKEQQGNFTVNCHVCFSQLENETTSFALIDTTIENIYYAVHGLEGAYYSPLKRVSEIQDINHGRIIHWILSFECGVQQPGQAKSTLVLVSGGTLVPDISKNIDIDSIIIRTGDGV